MSEPLAEMPAAERAYLDAASRMAAAAETLRAFAFLNHSPAVRSIVADRVDQCRRALDRLPPEQAQ